MSEASVWCEMLLMPSSMHAGRQENMQRLQNNANAFFTKHQKLSGEDERLSFRCKDRGAVFSIRQVFARIRLREDWFPTCFPSLKRTPQYQTALLRNSGIISSRVLFLHRKAERLRFRIKRVMYLNYWWQKWVNSLSKWGILKIWTSGIHSIYECRSVTQAPDSLIHSLITSLLTSSSPFFLSTLHNLLCTSRKHISQSLATHADHFCWFWSKTKLIPSHVPFPVRKEGKALSAHLLLLLLRLCTR